MPANARSDSMMEPVHVGGDRQQSAVVVQRKDLPMSGRRLVMTAARCSGRTASASAQRAADQSPGSAARAEKWSPQLTPTRSSAWDTSRRYSAL